MIDAEFLYYRYNLPQFVSKTPGFQSFCSQADKSYLVHRSCPVKSHPFLLKGRILTLLKPGCFFVILSHFANNSPTLFATIGEASLYRKICMRRSVLTVEIRILRMNPWINPENFEIAMPLESPLPAPRR
jgi:hypothetical protein